MKKSLLAGALVAVAASASAQTWNPPVGIPRPPFGVEETCGATTINVPAGGNIPNPIPAGAVVQLSGTYAGERQIRFAGFSDQHACLRGPAQIVGEWQVSGTFGILEGLRFSGNTLVLLSPSNAIAARDVEVSGITAARNSGIGITTWNSSTTSNILVLRANIHDNVPPQAGGDPDNHGVSIGPNRGSGGTVRDIWVLDSTMTNNSGDGIQVNGEETGIAGALHHIYLGRNRASRHWQGGFWTKNATDVVMSQNVAFDNAGHGLGYQYDPKRVWIIFNEAYGNAAGIRTGSQNNGGRRDVYIVGNLFRDNSAVGIEVNDAVAGDFLIAHNTIAGNPKGISNGYYAASPIVSSNVVSFGGIDFSGGGGSPTLRSNFLGSPPFSPGSYRLAPGSAAIDRGVAEAAYAKFQQLYSLNVAVDRDGNARPQGTAWDPGAYEFGGAPPSPTPPPASPTPPASPSPSATPPASPPPASPSPSPHPTPTPVPTPTPTPTPVPTPTPLAPSFSFPACTGGVRSTSQVSQTILPDGRTKRVIEVKTTEGRCRIEVFSER